MIISDYNSKIQSVLEITSLDNFAANSEYENFRFRLYLRRNPTYKAPGVGESDRVPYTGMTNGCGIITPYFAHYDVTTSEWYDLPNANSTYDLIVITQSIKKSSVINSISTSSWGDEKRVDSYVSSYVMLEYELDDGSRREWTANSSGRFFGRFASSRLTPSTRYVSSVGSRILGVGYAPSPDEYSQTLDVTTAPNTVNGGTSGSTSKVLVVAGPINNSLGPQYFPIYDSTKRILEESISVPYKTYPYVGPTTTFSILSNYDNNSYWLYSVQNKDSDTFGRGFISSWTQVLDLEVATEIETTLSRSVISSDYYYVLDLKYEPSGQSSEVLYSKRLESSTNIPLDYNLKKRLIDIAAVDSSATLDLVLTTYIVTGDHLWTDAKTITCKLDITVFHDLGGTPRLENATGPTKVVTAETIRPLADYLTYEMSAYSGSTVTLPDTLVTSSPQDFTFINLIAAAETNPTITVKLVARSGTTIVSEYSSTLRVTIHDKNAPLFLKDKAELSTPGRPNLSKYSLVGMYLIGYSKLDVEIEVEPAEGTTIASMSLLVGSTVLFRTANSNRLMTSINTLQSTSVDMSELDLKVEVVDNFGRVTRKDYDYYLVDTSRPLSVGYLDAYRVNSGVTSTVPTPTEDVIGEKLFISHMVVSNRIVHPVSRVVMNIPQVKIALSSGTVLYDKSEPQQIRVDTLTSDTYRNTVRIVASITAKDDFSETHREMVFHDDKPPLTINDTSVTIGAYPGTVNRADPASKLIVAGESHFDGDVRVPTSITVGLPPELNWGTPRQWFDGRDVKVNKIHPVEVGHVYQWDDNSPNLQYDQSDFWSTQGSGKFTYVMEAGSSKKPSSLMTRSRGSGQSLVGTIVHTSDLPVAKMDSGYWYTQYSTLLCTTGDGQVFSGVYSTMWDERSPDSSYTVTPLIWSPVQSSNAQPINQGVINFNEYLTPGVYTVRTTDDYNKSSNAPRGSAAGRLTVTNLTDYEGDYNKSWVYVQQIYYDLYGNEFYRRGETSTTTTIKWGAWRVRSEDTGWINLQTTGGYTPYVSGGISSYYTPMYRVLNSVLYIVGALAPSGNALGTSERIVAILPQKIIDRVVVDWAGVQQGSSLLEWTAHIFSKQRGREPGLYASRSRSGGTAQTFSTGNWMPLNVVVPLNPTI